MAVLVALAAMLLPAVPARASVAQFQVMNTDSPPPDGVWFRNSPSTADTDRVTGHGVYAGDVMGVDCYATGDAVGDYGNTVWYRGTNLTRPTVPGTGAANSGWLNTHYVNDGMSANQVYPGIPACGASGYQFGTINTANPPPDGVWFRNSPATADTDRVTGHGVYSNDVVRVDCYARGDAVGPNSNGLWYRGANLTRPTVPGSGAPNTGYLNAYYVNDGMNANNPYPGVPTCDVPPPPPPPVTGHASVFYVSKYDPRYAPSPAINLGPTAWRRDGATCDQNATMSYGATAAADPGGRPVTTLAGWSLGRHGPIFFMGRGTRAELQRVNYTLMIDPGNYSDMTGSCDQLWQGGQRIARWLNVNRSARMTVLAGDYTATGFHKGIQEYWFNAVRDAERTLGANLTDRILVCNYAGAHTTMMEGSKRYVNAAPLTSCPTVTGATRLGHWSP